MGFWKFWPIYNATAAAPNEASMNPLKNIRVEADESHLHERQSVTGAVFTQLW
jgi:hypothetical protein